MPESVQLITLGCPKNDVDSEVIGNILSESGQQLRNEPDSVSTVFINTCGFIDDAKKESLDTIKEALNRKKTGQVEKVIVAGCLVKRYRRELEESFKDVDAFFEVSDFKAIRNHFNLPQQERDYHSRYQLTPKHYSFLKISEGCDYTCTFCAIPGIRGMQKSRPLESLIDEAKRLADQGVKELILIAEDSTRYGKDLKSGEDLCTLMRALSGIGQLKWIRLLYAYPKSISDELIDIISDSPNICKYIDMPIQHIADPVLKRMNRTYRRSDVEKTIQRFRERIPNIVLRTTVIVGFPGETKDEFVELSDFLMDVEFDRLGAFMYSDEDGTEAIQLDGKVPHAEMVERFEEIQMNQQFVSERKNKRLAGKTLKVIVDYYDEDSSIGIGRTANDAPMIDQIVKIKRPVTVGEFTEITVDQVTATEIIGS